MPSTVQDKSQEKSTTTNGQETTAQQQSKNQWPENVGILSMEMYFPTTYVDQSELEEHDEVGKGILFDKHLKSISINKFCIFYFLKVNIQLV